MGYSSKWNKLEELNHIGIQGSLQSSMDIFNHTMSDRLLENREKISQLNELQNIAISTGSFSDRARKAISQANIYTVSSTRKLREQANLALGLSEPFADKVTRDSLIDIKSVYTINEIERFKKLNQISFVEESKLSYMINDYTKKIREQDTFKLMKKLAIEVATPMKLYAEQMQIALFEKNKEASKIYSKFSDLYKPQMEIASKSIQTIQENFNSIWENNNIKDKSAFLSTTVDSYRSIHDILDHKSIANMFPDNIDLLIQGLIDKEPITQQYLRTTNNRPISIRIEESRVLAEIEAIKSDLLESIKNNQQLNQTIYKLYTFVMAQKDPKIILFLQQYLLPIVLSIISSFIFKYMDTPKEPLLKTNNQAVFLKKQLRLGLKKYIPNPKERIQYRIVNVDRLNIREGQSRKTEIISHLNFADVVQIIKKKKNWTLIQKYNKEQNTLIQGWVFTRYLAPIK